MFSRALFSIAFVQSSRNCYSNCQGHFSLLTVSWGTTSSPSSYFFHIVFYINAVVDMKSQYYSFQSMDDIDAQCCMFLFTVRGSVCNVLLTSCHDGVCRLWAETLLPEDCLLGEQICETTTSSIASNLSHAGKHKDRIQHALEVL